MENLKRLSDAEQTLSYEARRQFLNAFAGAVSTVVGEKEWARCIESALKVINREVR